MKSSADEMELYAQANKKFRQVFNRQEHMKTFRTYDRIEVCFSTILVTETMNVPGYIILCQCFTYSYR